MCLNNICRTEAEIIARKAEEFWRNQSNPSQHGNTSMLELSFAVPWQAFWASCCEAERIEVEVLTGEGRLVANESSCERLL